MRAIGGVFGRPAFGALYEHMIKVQDCLTLLHPMMLSFTKQDFEAVQRSAREMHQHENEADKIKNEIRRALSRSIFTAVERTEMLLLLKAQDDVSDNCDEVARLLEIRETPVWVEIAVEFMRLTERVVETGAVLGHMEERLKDLEGTTYPHAEMERLAALADQLQHGEHETAALEQAALRKIFENENRTDPVTLIFLMQIARALGDTASAAENTADVLERMMGMR